MFLLETENLYLRHLQALDGNALYVLFSDPEVMRFGDGIQTREWVQAWLTAQIEKYRQRGYGPYAVVEKVSHAVIGYCGLFDFDDVNGRAEVEIGYRLVRSVWGKGYATQAARVVRDHAFTALNMNRLIAMIDPSNIASIHVAEKIGMHYEQDVLLDGYTHPDHVYAIQRAS